MGLGAAAATVGTAIAETGLDAAVASAIGSGLVDAAAGAALGAGTSAISGGDIGQGALMGGITGGAIGGFGPAIGGLSGLGTVGGDVLAGAARGALGAGITGTDPLMGAGMGAASGLASGVLSSATAPDTLAAAPSGGAASAAEGTALPGATAAESGAIIDPTQVPTATTDAGGFTGSASGTSAGGVAGTSAGAPGDSYAPVEGTSASAPTANFPMSSAGGGADTGQLLSTVTSPAYSGTGATPGSTVDVANAGLSPQQQIASYLGTTPSQVTYASGAGGGIVDPLTGQPLVGEGGAVGGGGAGGGGAGSVKAFLANPSLSSAGNVLSSNPGLALSALGMGYSALKGNQQPKGYNQVNSIAQQMGAQGAQLSNAALNNALPAGAQAQLNQAANAAKASIRSQYAQMGLSGSTMETQALANVDQQIAAQGFNMVQSLYQQGVNESGMAANLYNNIMQINAQQNEALSGAVSNFAGALGGSSLGGGQPRAAGYYGG